MNANRLESDPRMVDIEVLLAEAVDRGLKVGLKPNDENRLAVFVDGVEWCAPSQLGWALSNAERIGLSEKAEEQAQELFRKRAKRKYKQKMRKLSTSAHCLAHNESLPIGQK